MDNPKLKIKKADSSEPFRGFSEMAPKRHQIFLLKKKISSIDQKAILPLHYL